MDILLMLKTENSLGWTNNRLETLEHRFSEIKRQINKKQTETQRGKKNKKNKKLRYLEHNQMA